MPIDQQKVSGVPLTFNSPMPPARQDFIFHHIKELLRVPSLPHAKCHPPNLLPLKLPCPLYRPLVSSLWLVVNARGPQFIDPASFLRRPRRNVKHHRPLSRRDAIEKQAQEAKRPRAKVKDLQRPVNAACICHFASLPGSQRIAVAAAELAAVAGGADAPAATRDGPCGSTRRNLLCMSSRPGRPDA